jgi:endonuclease YncB( thermonuclease family)
VEPADASPSPRKRRFDVSPESAYWTIVALLLGTSAFFTASVELRRNAWQGFDTAQVVSGTEVKVLQVIDGDEVSVEGPDGIAFVVRVLGIKAFDPKVNDPGLSEVGNACVRALTRRTESAGKLVVEFDERKTDKAGRLLAYLRKDEVDVGEALVHAGHALAYVRYPHAREGAYKAAELEAKTRGEGLWSIPAAVERANALHAKWEAERAEAAK